MKKNRAKSNKLRNALPIDLKNIYLKVLFNKNLRKVCCSHWSNV